MEGKRVRLTWSPDVEFVIEEEEQSEANPLRYVAFAALVTALAVPAAGVSKGSAVCRRRSAPGEGTLNAGRLGGLWREAVGRRRSRSRPAARCLKYAGSSDEMVNADDVGRRRAVRHGLGIGRRQPPPDLRRRRRRGQHRA